MLYSQSKPHTGEYLQARVNVAVVPGPVTARVITGLFEVDAEAMIMRIVLKGVEFDESFTAL